MERHIRRRTSSDGLTIIAIHKTEKQLLEWMEPHEFRYKGMMYDIVQEESSGDSIYYHCVADYKEAALLAKWERTIQEEQEPLSTSQGRWLRLLGLFSAEYMATAPLLMLPSIRTRTQSVFLYNFSLQLWQVAPLLPPPKLGATFMG